MSFLSNYSWVTRSFSDEFEPICNVLDPIAVTDITVSSVFLTLPASYSPIPVSPSASRRIFIFTSSMIDQLCRRPDTIVTNRTGIGNVPKFAAYTSRESSDNVQIRQHNGPLCGIDAMEGLLCTARPTLHSLYTLVDMQMAAWLWTHTIRRIRKRTYTQVDEYRRWRYILACTI